MTNLKFSIIIPVYCVEAYLRNCLDSILAQTYIYWECILVDDGSPDRSGAICDEYSAKDSRFKVIHKKNGGVSSARNLALEIAKEEWVIFVDSDDSIEPEMLEDIQMLARENPDVSLFSWGYTYIYDDGSCKVVKYDSNKMDAMDLFLHRFQDGIAFYAYKRSFLLHWSISFPKGIRYSEDQCYTCKYLLNNPVCYTIGKAYYNYYYREDSACGRIKTLNDYADNLRVAVEIAKYAEMHKNISSVFSYRVICRFFSSFLWYMIRLDSYDHKLATTLYRNAYREVIKRNIGFIKNVRLLLCNFFLNRYIKHLKNEK